MAGKLLEVPSIGTVRLFKRRGAKSIRLSVTHEGQVRVTMPLWTPYRLGVEFVKQKEAWVTEQLQRTSITLQEGARIGKAHRLFFAVDPKRQSVQGRLSGTHVKVLLPHGMPEKHPLAQDVAKKTAERALKLQAEQLLPKRLSDLSATTGLDYNNLTIRKLKRRWGSCSDKKDIVLNYYLMQLPWHLIDYVIIHELIHTEVLNHGPDFWRLFESYLPEAKSLRKEMRQYQPTLTAGL